MNKKTIILGIISGLFFANGMFASNPVTEKERCELNSINYIEDEIEIDLGFDTADYLPEGFDAHTYYLDLNSINYIEENKMDEYNSKRKHLPIDFDAYSYPSDAMSINFIDESDFFELGFDSKKNLPENFNPFSGNNI